MIAILEFAGGSVHIEDEKASIGKVAVVDLLAAMAGTLEALTTVHAPVAEDDEEVVIQLPSGSFGFAPTAPEEPDDDVE